MGIISEHPRTGPKRTIASDCVLEVMMDMDFRSAKNVHRPQSHSAALEAIDWVIKRWLVKPAPAAKEATVPLKFETVRQEIGFIDAKASAVLTHVSVMVATAGILMSNVAESALERTIMVSELALYLLIAVLCIRCIMHPPNWAAHVSQLEVSKDMHDEVLYLRRLVYFCSAFTVTVTIILMITVPVLSFA
jgi:hypothetical protein